jgi:KEOPS complex subunit Pcc1
MKAKVIVRLPFTSEKRMDALINALGPEIDKQITTRSQATLTKENQFLVLKIEANDTIALRAALNSYLRWINATIKVFDTVENTFF